MIAPELSALSEGSQLQGIHVHHAPAVFLQVRAKLRREHVFLPVIDKGFHAITVDVVDRVGNAHGRLRRLPGAVDPEIKDQVIPVHRRRPGQLPVCDLTGQHQGALLIEKGLPFALLLHADRDNRHEILLRHARHHKL